ncbi:MAG: DUF2341 domain-containing protein [Promethearchaeota archaeon]
MRKSLILIAIIFCIFLTSLEDLPFSSRSLLTENSLSEEMIPENSSVLRASIIPAGWTYHSLIALDQSTPTPDYNVKIVLTPSNFDYSRAQISGADIRFFDLKNNPLSYWIELWDSIGTSIIWVKIPDAGTSSFNMFSGNTAASSGSDGEATFLFFDDFLGSVIDSSKWTTESDTYSTSDVAGGVVSLQTDTPSDHASSVHIGFSDFYVNHGQTYGAKGANGVSTGRTYGPSDTFFTRNFTYEVGWEVTDNALSYETWFTHEIRRIHASLAEFDNGTAVIAHTNSSTIPTLPLQVRILTMDMYAGPGTWYGEALQSTDSWGMGHAVRARTWHDGTGSPEIRCDWVFVRKCAESEPLSSIINDPIRLHSPEATVYNSPMSGYYPATFGFENERHTATGLELEFLDEYSTAGEYVGIGVHDGPIYGHKKVLHIGDAQAATYTYGVHYFNTPPNTGTIQFYTLVENIHAPYTGTHYLQLRAFDDTIAVEIRINVVSATLSNLEYSDGTTWHSISDLVSYEWYHHSIQFDCELGANGQFTWTVANENGTEISRVQNVEFQNDLDTLDELYLASDIPTYFGATQWDAFGFSWDPNYYVGDNLNEGLLLNYTTPTPPFWTGYSLDGGANITTLGNTTILMPPVGVHTVQVFGNDSLGNNYRSELRKYEVLELPSAPLNLQATAGEHSVTLNWAPPSYDGGSVITHYNIYRGTSSGSHSFLNSTTGTTLDDSTVVAGTTYYYVVTAVNSAGESFFSNEAWATPIVPATVPTPPRGLLATPSEDNIHLSWSPPTDTGGRAISHYNIYRGTSSGSYSFLEDTSNTFFEDTTIVRETTYYYVVTAVNPIGESEYSDEVSATLPMLSDTTTTTTSGEPGTPRITSFSSFLTLSLSLGILVLFRDRFKRK